MREQFWSSEKIGTRVRLYSCDVPWETRHHTVNGQLEIKEEYTELYDPAQECWKNLSSNLTKETFLPLVIEPFSINDIFKAHLMFASISFSGENLSCLKMKTLPLKHFIGLRSYLISA